MAAYQESTEDFVDRLAAIQCEIELLKRKIADYVEEARVVLAEVRRREEELGVRKRDEASK